MAESSPSPDRQNIMKDSHSSNNSPSELCEDITQENKNDLEPGYIEERFRVDRKKLEQMLQGRLVIISVIHKGQSRGVPIVQLVY